MVSRINPPDNPARLALPADWRVLAFGVALTLAVTLLFGLAPALRASKVNPASALRGGASNPHARRRLMHALIAAQVAFCFVVLFVAGLFAATFDHLAHCPPGFLRRPRSHAGCGRATRAAGCLLGAGRRPSARRTRRGKRGAGRMAASQRQFLERLCIGERRASWPDRRRIHEGFARLARRHEAASLSGRDFRPDDTLPGTAMVNETFVRTFLNGLSPIGVRIAKNSQSFQVVGVVRDTPYRDVHEAARPVVFVPFHSAQPTRNATFVVRTASANPLALASILRREVSRARVSNVRTQMEFVHAQTVRERLLAMLALFFAAVALVLAGIGLYGVLDYSVLQRRREIGIRMAVGAQAGDIAWRVTAEVFRVVLAGALAGLALGLLSVRYIATLLYQVKPADLPMLAPPSLIVLAVAAISALPAVWHAVRIDPVAMLRVD